MKRLLLVAAMVLGLSTNAALANDDPLDCKNLATQAAQQILREDIPAAVRTMGAYAGIGCDPQIIVNQDIDYDSRYLACVGLYETMEELMGPYIDNKDVMKGFVTTAAFKSVKDLLNATHYALRCHEPFYEFDALE